MAGKDFYRGWGQGWGNGAAQTAPAPGTGAPQPMSTGFFDAKDSYGAQNNPAPYNYGLGEFANSQVGQAFLDDRSNFDALWQRVLAEQGGIDFYSPFGQFANRVTPQLDAGYRAALATNPTLDQRSYLTKMAPQMYRQFQGLDYSQRGEDPGRNAPVTRTLARTI
jgi:hypothetical protein